MTQSNLAVVASCLCALMSGCEGSNERTKTSTTATKPAATAKPPATNKPPATTKPPAPTTVPADFAISSRSGPIHASRGNHKFVDVKPKAGGGWLAVRSSLHQPKSPAAPKTVNSKTTFTAKQLLPLYQAVVTHNFFGLQNSYASHRPQLSGGVSSLTVTANGKTKTVRVSVSQPAFATIYQQLDKLVP